MLQKSFILGLFILSALYAAGQHNEWREFGLNGQVQSVTTYYYLDSNFDTVTSSVKDSSDWRYKTTRFFNEHGMVEWYVATSRSPIDTTSGVMMSRSTYVSYEFDSTHVKTGGASYTKETLESKTGYTSSEYYTYNWISPYKYMEYMYNTKDSSLLSTFEYEMDASFFIVRERQQSTGLFDAPVEITYTKNASGQIAVCYETYPGEETFNYEKVYEYLASDALGNPLCFLIHTDSPATHYTLAVVKEYSYFHE